jgi:hypothetical protein
MTNLLEGDTTTSTGTPPAPSIAAPIGQPLLTTPAPAFPPPPVLGIDDDLHAQRLRTLAIIAGLGFAAAILMGLLWMSARGGDDSAIAERDAAVAERDASTAERQDVAAALITTQSDLNASQADNVRLQAELDAALAASADVAPPVVDSSQTDELNGVIDDLTVRNQDLAEQLAAVQAELDAALAAPADAPTFDATTTPQFSRYIGELMSSRNGSSRLAQAQSECFGAVIVNTIGLDALGKGLNLSASAADNNLVVGAMQSSANFCNIPLELIF